MSNQHSRSLIPALIAVGGVMLLAWLGLSKGGATPSVSPEPKIDASTQQGALTLSETSWNWGEIPMSRGTATREIAYQNASSDPVTITSMVTSCMCTTVSLIRANGSMVGPKGMPGHGGNSSVRETIQPGETGTLRIIFDPNAHGPEATGPIRRSVKLATGSDLQPVIELTFSGTVTK